MNIIQKKLHSQNGASIIIAFMLFLICGFVAAVTLSAATVNAGKHRNQRQEQQRYLSVSSAAQMLRDTISGMEMTGVETQTAYFCSQAEIEAQNSLGDEFVSFSPAPHEDLPNAGHPTVCKKLTITKGDGRLSELIAEGAYKVYLSTLKYNTWSIQEFPEDGWKKEFVIRSDHMEPVHALMLMDGNYRLVIQLTTDSAIASADNYSMTLVFNAAVPEPKDTEPAIVSCPETHSVTWTHKKEDGHYETLTEDLVIENKYIEKLTTITWSEGDIRKGD